VTREDGSYWSYTYNDRGELISGKKYWVDNSIVWGEQTEYSFDNVGNRSFAKTGGNQLGSLRQSNFTANSLNQYSQRSVPAAVDVTGAASTSAVVTVNNQSTVRSGEYFYKELLIDNTSGPVSQQINVIGARSNFGAGGEDAITQKDARVYLPGVTESFTYDDDGNLLNDGRWVYTWDGENRLIVIEAAMEVPAEAKSKLEFAYNDFGQRIRKIAYTWNVATSSYQLESVSKFIYVEESLIAEVDGEDNLLRSYSWVRGQLLLINDSGNTYAVGYDGANNLTCLVNTTTGNLSAQYDYDPYGNTLRATAEPAVNNPFRFASQYHDKETGQIYYGFRFYSSSMGRWLSRDPAEEYGGLNLYAFTANDAINHLDIRGLFRVKVTADAFIPWDWVRLPSVPLSLTREYIHGDGREPGNPWNGAYRMISWAEFDFPAEVPHDIDRSVSKYMASSSSTRETRIGSRVMASVTESGPWKGLVKVYRIGPCEVGIELNMGGSVPAIVGGHSLRLTITIT
jgi:RHS repeat-associated protein